MPARRLRTLVPYFAKGIVMRNRFLACVSAMVLVCLAGCSTNRPAATGETAGSGRPTVLLNVTSGPNDPQAVWMALQLARHSLTAGRDVVIFFNVRGAQIPVRTLPPDMEHRDRIRQGLDSLLAEPRVTVLACAQCMQSFAVSPDDLLPGVRIATVENLLVPIDADTVVFSY